jgi:hypothetical protein
MNGDTTFETRQCEYEVIHEVQYGTTNTTAPDIITLHRTYSCAMFYCPYPNKGCRVKKSVSL